jgi:hypothetical protein
VSVDIAHLVPSLADKPPAGETLPDLGSKPEKDPFQPPFVPEELVGDLEHYYILVRLSSFLLPLLSLYLLAFCPLLRPAR